MSGSIYKVILVGDTGVGKSTFLSYAESLKLPTYLENRRIKATETVTTTVGVEFHSMNIDEPEKMRLHFWDTAGQELFRSIVPYYFRAAAVALVFFDVYEESTFSSIPGWLDMLIAECVDVPQLIMVGSKALLCSRGNSADIIRSSIDKSRIDRLVAKYGAEYIDVSIRERPEDTVRIIDKVVDTIIKKRPAPQQVCESQILLDASTTKCCVIL